MKPTKEILSLIEKRRKYGGLANDQDNQILEWIDKHNIDSRELHLSYGCMFNPITHGGGYCTYEVDLYVE